MIKGISILRPAADADVYERLTGFFEAMGFAKGSGWKDQESTGASFLAPLGNLEFVHGQFPPVADLMVEVTSLDSAHQAADDGCAPAENPRLRAYPRLPKPIGNRASSLSNLSRASPSLSGHGPIPKRASQLRSKAISPQKECALPSW